MGIHTATLVVWFMGVCVLLHPRLGFSAVVLQASLRGRLLRRSLPFAVLIPIAAAVIGLLLALAFGWTPEVLFALTATVAVVLAAGLIWWLSALVDDWQKEANEQAARLARANEALEQYASSAAHDLKAPARHVMLYGELLEEALAKGDTATARRHARLIRDSALEMPKIIDGMLDFSRSAFTRVTRTENSLSELVQAGAASHASGLEAAQARITVLREVRILCDGTLITTVFQNLIGNALANRRKDRPLAIRIDGVREERRAGALRSRTMASASSRTSQSSPSTRWPGAFMHSGEGDRHWPVRPAAPSSRVVAARSGSTRPSVTGPGSNSRSRPSRPASPEPLLVLP